MPFILILTVLFAQAPAAKTSSRQWHAANFRGLIVGKSKRADMLRRFGQPKWSQTKPGDKDEDRESPRVTWNNYEGIGELRGVTNIATSTRTGVITRIDFFPEQLTKGQAIAHFGAGYIITRYAFDECEHDEDVEAIYESPNGPLTSLEYRARGIAISIDNDDLVTKIRYVNGPIGSRKSKCKQSGF